MISKAVRHLRDDESRLNINPMKNAPIANENHRSLAMAERYIIVADQIKRVTQRGEKTPIPVEVVLDALTLGERFLKKLGGRTSVRPDPS
jgi:hypothetical protein